MKKIILFSALLTIAFLLDACKKEEIARINPPTTPVTNQDNKVPIANAGEDQIIYLPAKGGFLNGSGTDADGTVTSYQWTKISGPAAKIISPNLAQTKVSYFEKGEYVFQLTVTDDQGDLGIDSVNVSVLPAILPTIDGPNILILQGLIVSKWFPIDFTNVDSVHVKNGFYSGRFNYDTTLNYTKSDYIELAYMYNGSVSNPQYLKLPSDLKFPSDLFVSWFVHDPFPYYGPNDFNYVFSLEYELTNSSLMMKLRNKFAMPAIDSADTYGFYDVFESYANELSRMNKYRFILVHKSKYNSLNIDWDNYRDVVNALNITL